MDERNKWLRNARDSVDFDQRLLKNISNDACSDEEDGTYYTHLTRNEINETLRGTKNPTMVQLRKYMLEMESANYERMAYNTAVKENQNLGVCVIVNLQEESRNGSKQDVAELEKVFKALNFDVRKGDNELKRSTVNIGRIKQAKEKIEARVKAVNDCLTKDPKQTESVKDKLLLLYEEKDNVLEKHGECKRLEEIKTDIADLKSGQLGTYDTLCQSVISMFIGLENRLIFKALDDVIEESKTEQHKATYSNHKMFVLVIMAHGGEGWVQDDKSQQVMLSSVYKSLAHRSFKAMTGKPKWVIVQTCNNKEISEVDTGPTSDMRKTDEVLPPEKRELQVGTREEMSDDGISGDEYSENEDGESNTKVISSEKLKNTDITGKRAETDDLCVWLSCFPKHKSARSSIGSVFIRAVIDVLYKHSHHMHLEQMFQRVQSKVRTVTAKRQVIAVKENRKEKKGAQHPTRICTFLDNRRVYLFPKGTKDGDDNKTVKTDTDPDKSTETTKATDPDRSTEVAQSTEANKPTEATDWVLS